MTGSTEASIPTHPGPQAWVRGPTGYGTTGTPTTSVPVPIRHPVRHPGPHPTQQPVQAPAPDLVTPRPVTPDPAAAWSAPPESEPPRPGRRSQTGVGWVRAHGGAGASALAGLFGGVDVGGRWPEPARGEPRRILIVGRTNAEGLQSVAQSLNALREGRAPEGLELLSLVLVADAPGRLPFSLARRVRIIGSVAPVRRVPWIPAWRVGGRLGTLPKELVELADLVGVRPGHEEDDR
ncbi:DUF6668 family protein [Streptomyces sp. CA-249302]|uniref:DUF6668 family protein n=1 Tax=Streptomyces sp. CA-249302 TaxID=3240058 RepID=UPI003D93FBD5